MKFFDFRNLVALVAIGLFAHPAMASDSSGKVTSLYARSSDQLQVVNIAGAPSGARPPCAAIQPYYIIKDENSRAGQAQYATLLAAQLAGKRVEVQGAGSCTRWGDGEDILLVRIID